MSFAGFGFCFGLRRGAAFRASALVVPLDMID
jgi:hypothetical protein